MKSISVITVVLSLFIVIASCQKDSNKDLSKKGMLTSHGWKISSVETYGLANASEIKLEACSMDDCLTFKPNGTYTYTYGSLKCDPNEADSSGSWSMSEDGSDFKYTSYYSLVSVDMKSLVIKWEYSTWGWIYTYIPF